MHSTPPVDATQRAALYARALSTSQAYDVGPLSPQTTELNNMGWFSQRFGNNFFSNPNEEGWTLNGLSLPGGIDDDWNTEDPQFVVLREVIANRLRAMHRKTLDGGGPALKKHLKAAKWGGALYILGHELGHNRTPSLDEADADYYAQQHFKHLGRRLGLSKQQARRAFRAYYHGKVLEQPTHES